MKKNETLLFQKKIKKNKNCEISKMRNKNDYNPELFCITYIQHNKQMIFLKFYGKVGFKSWLDFSSYLSNLENIISTYLKNPTQK